MKSVGREEVAKLFIQAKRVALPGCSGQSLWIDKLLSELGPELGETEFSGVFIPGINTTDYAALGPECRSEVFFLMPSLRESYAAGKVRYLPLPYTGISRYYQSGKPFDLCVVQLAPPDEDGRMSFGSSAEFSPIAAANARCVLAHINPNMPRTNGPYLREDQVDFYIEEASDLLTVAETAASETFERIAAHIAPLIPDGATLQFGLGKTQQAMLQALTAHRNLCIHSGMVSDPVLGLLESGALRKQAGSITTGTLLGSQSLYEELPRFEGLRLAATDYTHSQQVLAGIEGFFSINSALSVDLFGQINAELMDGVQISGCGGLTDFIHGAQLSPGGRSVIALPATAKGGTVSRIEVALAAQPVSVGRLEVDMIATEYGVAELRHKSVHERAEALIAIAAPQHQEALREGWKEISRRS